MPDWSPAIANEFIRYAQQHGIAFTQMQLQKLVYIAHGWNLAINGERLTNDDPEAWKYGPVYRELRSALRLYGDRPIPREIENRECNVGHFDPEPPTEPMRARLTENERQVIERVARDYGRFHAFQLSALTHRPRTPWSEVYQDGAGCFESIPPGMIRDHFVELATTRQSA